MTQRSTRRSALALLLLIAGCAFKDSDLAQSARTRLLGMDEIELVSCLGAPDQHATYGTTNILTYYTASSSGASYSIPVLGGFTLSNGGNCHATFRSEGGKVTRILYSGEKNASFAPDAYCAPILRTCLETLDAAAKPPG